MSTASVIDPPREPGAVPEVASEVSVFVPSRNLVPPDVDPATVIEVIPPFPVRPITVEQYEYLVEVGFFGDARVEMLDGFAVNKMTHGSLASTVICLIADLLREVIPKEIAIRCQVPIKLARSVPEPDIAIVVGPLNRYRANHPIPDEIFVLIEVSDSTLATDRGPKLRTYARNAIREYWIVNCVDRQIEIYAEPTMTDGPPRYAVKTVLYFGEIATVRIDGQPPIEIPLAMLFGE